MYIDVLSKWKCAVNWCAADLLFPQLICDMAQMTECVASSISRSTHSDVRWRDGRRTGPGVYFFGSSHSQAWSNGVVSQTKRGTSTQKQSYLGELPAQELRTQANTRCESISVPQDNPLDTRPEIGTANLTTDTNT